MDEIKKHKYNDIFVGINSKKLAKKGLNMKRTKKEF